MDVQNQQCKRRTRPDTRPGISRGSWAGALEEAVYTTASVTCNWAGAEMQKPLGKYREKKRVTYLRTDGHTYITITQKKIAQIRKVDF